MKFHNRIFAIALAVMFVLALAASVSAIGFSPGFSAVAFG